MQRYSFVPPGGGPGYDWSRDHTFVKVSSADSGGAFALMEDNLKPGFALGLHLHRRHAETFYILEGEVDFYLDGDWMTAPPGTTVHGALDDERRSTLMRTHSGLHVLCGTVFRDFGALVSGGNMEPGEARMDFNLPEVPPGFKQTLEDTVNAEIEADRRIEVRLLPRAEALTIPDLVRTQSVAPPDTDPLRVVDIVGLDQQADGGTHVASTRQIGRIQVYKVENKGRQNRRVRIRLTA